MIEIWRQRVFNVSTDMNLKVTYLQLEIKKSVNVRA